MSKPTYTCLTRPRARHAVSAATHTRSSLWLGGDHLLSVQITGYTERYRRYFFRDIQSIVLQNTRRRLVQAWVLGACVAGSAIGAFFVGDVAATWLLGIFAGGFLAFFIYNLTAGPSVVGHIRTAVQAEELPSLHRLGQAQRVLAKVRPLIIAAQGEVPPTEITPRLEQLMMESGPASPHS